MFAFEMGKNFTPPTKRTLVISALKSNPMHTKGRLEKIAKSIVHPRFWNAQQGEGTHFKAREKLDYRKNLMQNDFSDPISICEPQVQGH